MSIGKLAGLYALCAAVFFALDFVWLSVATPRIYRPLLGELLAEKPRLGVAAAFYLAYVVGIIALAVLPGVREGSAVATLWRAALFGLLAYATYDLTNLSTIREWPAIVSIADMAWGTAVTSAVGLFGFYAAGWVGL
jgi:uncharacterized membrane protein